MSGKITTRHSNGGTEAPVSQEESSSHIERVLSSAIFRGSETSCQLLLFLAKSSAEDPNRHPKEHEIATGVLGRGGEFDPRVDSVVRVQIGRLRSKLAVKLDLLCSILAKYSIDPQGPLSHFEILLKVRTMAGSPHEFEVIACHQLKH